MDDLMQPVGKGNKTAALLQAESRPRSAASIQLLNYRNLCQTQCVRHLRLAQARSIIFEQQFRLSFIELEFAKAIGVREFA
jgi:hypothetical protein